MRLFKLRSRSGSTPLFGFAGEVLPQKGRRSIKRDQGGHERWAEAILPADAEAGIIETPTSRRPLFFVAALVVGGTAVLAAQIFNLEIINGQRNLGLADGNRLRQNITRAPRGVIYDRHKTVLAQNYPSFDVTVTPSLLPRDKAKRQELYARVAPLIKMSPGDVGAKVETDCINGEVAAKLPRNRAEFDCLSATQPRLVVNNIDRDVALNLDQLASQVPGFSLDVNPIREYKDGGLLAAVLGYTGRVSEEDLQQDNSYTTTDFIGKLGIEKQYEQELRGQNGSEQTEVDASGRPIKVLSAKQSAPGENLVLSIDMDLQRKLAETIQNQMKASGSEEAAGVALNPKTGEVLAAVNLPSYDNNLFAKGISQKDYTHLIKDPGQPLFNKAISGAYPTGSVIKPLIGSAALQEHVVSPSTTVDDKGQLEIPNKYDPNVKYTFRSYEPGGLGIVNITKAIAMSSNVFFFTVGGGFGNIGGLGADRLINYYHHFGLGRKTGVDLPDETKGSVPSPESKKAATGEDWYLGDTYNISVGQGDLRASPLQMAVAISAVANGGNVLKPHFLREIQDSSGRSVSTVSPQTVEKGFIDPANLAVIQSAMKDVVSAPYGTACCKIAQSVPVTVAAKTGTAETVVSDTGDKNQTKPHAWFAAYAPAEDPQIVFVVLVTHAGEGAQFAAPAVRETLQWCFTRPGGCIQ
jgi:penicillin-binding protein 2